MKTFNRVIPCMAVVCMLLANVVASYAAETIVGTLSGDSPVWNRLKDSGATTSETCSATAFDSYNNGVAYEEFVIVTPTPGDMLNATVTAATTDTLLALYCDPFDPENPQSNLVAIDDDGNGYPNPALHNLALDPDTPYYLVVTSYSSTHAPLGTFEINLDGSWTTSTCAGKCGNYDTSWLCQCDTACVNYGDCCPDYDQWCSQTCEDQCGGEGIGGCWCDEVCVSYGDCCPDYDQWCLVQTCEGQCGGEGTGGCWCDEACVSFGDCCPDYGDICACDGKCDTYNAEGACWCDEECVNFGDCCPNFDYEEQCIGECEGQVCSAYTNDCDPDRIDSCLCATTAGEGGQCLDTRTSCSTLTACNNSSDCPLGWACALDTCCSAPSPDVCLPPCGTWDECEPQVCGTYTMDCNPPTNCICFATAEGGGACITPQICAGSTLCDSTDDCPSGYICTVDTCCSVPGPNICQLNTCSGLLSAGEGETSNGYAVGASIEVETPGGR